MRRGLEELRSCLAALREVGSPHDARAFVEVLRTLAIGFRPEGVEISFSPAGTPLPLGQLAQTTLVRTLQEALTNASRHAGASEVRVRLTSASAV